MKQFNNITLNTEYKNLYGETIKLVLDENLEMWFYHSDCNDDFERVDDLLTSKENDTFIFSYILSLDEQSVLRYFINTCDEMMGILVE